MILPTKHLSRDQALIDVGAEILAQLDRPRELSDLWDRVRAARADRQIDTPLSFDWLVLCLTFLFAIKAVEYDDGYVRAEGRAP